ncbi:hypothetical protein [Winogradskyella pulchriflava]|uniref:Right handed beta helix domain-containing protein n=1 Tax=Winogradskyella pulchriflava TaxID=1110688 RepID=A0ABV6QCE0_9FLAO
MKQLILIVFLFLGLYSFAQKEFHVFPIDGKTIKGSPNGDGSITKPWDLQTALSQTSQRVNGGDIIWLHNGIYNGRYKSTIASTLKDKYITVTAYKNDKVVLNGNVESKEPHVLEVNGDRVIYKNFEITFLGSYPRLASDENFKTVTGINHVKGEDCKFQNLVIHNVPSSGMGSWKLTGGTSIEDCVIYNNGYQGQRGHGVGIYVQNQSSKIRHIRNNIIFNNYYKGIEVWSATSKTQKEFVKNVTLTDNVIFNNGAPSGKPWDNLIIASGDADGINVAKDITVKNNVLYHNTDFSDTKNFGYGSSLTLGFTARALVEDISIIDNIIIGRNNTLNILHAKSVEFKHNTVYTGYVHFEKSTLPALESGAMNFDYNKFHTRKTAGLRILKYKDYKLTDWQKIYNIDTNSEWNHLTDFEIDPVLMVSELSTKPNHYNVALLQKEGNDVLVDFSEYGIEEGTSYKIYDLENRAVVVKSGKISDNKKVMFPMALSAFEKPLHNTVATKSADNFGVFRIEFEKQKYKMSFFKRLFGWLF